MTQLANKINKRITWQKLSPIRRLTLGKHLRFFYSWQFKFLRLYDTADNVVDFSLYKLIYAVYIIIWTALFNQLYLFPKRFS